MEVIYTNEFEEWFEVLSSKEQEDIGFVVRLLELFGVRLEFPHSSGLKGSNAALRELRPRKGRSPLRVVYAFDPRRDAVLLIGGDKRQGSKVYEKLIREAEKVWNEYLAEQAAGLHDEGDQP